MASVLKSMFAAGTGVDAAEFTGGRATQIETGKRRRRKRRGRSVLAAYARRREGRKPEDD